jgi:hypothetical protein
VPAARCNRRCIRAYIRIDATSASSASTNQPQRGVRSEPNAWSNDEPPNASSTARIATVNPAATHFTFDNRTGQRSQAIGVNAVKPPVNRAEFTHRGSSQQSGDRVLGHRLAPSEVFTSGMPLPRITPCLPDAIAQPINAP